MRQQQKRSSTASKAPQPSDLLDGEIALNTNGVSPALYIKDADGVVRQLGGAGQVGETSVNGRTGAVTLDASDVGLGDVDNTTDAAKPISTDTQTALDAKADLVGGKVPSSQIPAIAITTYLGAVADETAMLALSGQSGDWCNRTDTATTFVLIKTGGANLADWEEISYPSSGVVSVNTQTGVVVLGAGDVGAATAAQGTTADSALQPGEAATTAQGTKADSAVQPGDDVSDLNNDAGYITAVTAPVQSVNTQVGAVSLGLGNLSDVTTGSKSTGDVLSWDGAAWVSASSVDAGSY